MPTSHVSDVREIDESARIEPPPDVPDWVTIAEAALLTGAPIDNLERLVADGILFGWPLSAGRHAKGPLVVATQELSRLGLLGAGSPRPSLRAPIQPQAAPPGRTRTSSDPDVGPITRRRLQIALGILWLLDGLLQLQPFMFTRRFVTEVILPAAGGQPGIIARPIIWAGHFMTPHIALWNGVFAVTQIAIGVGLLWRRTVRHALLLSFAWALGVWWVGEGLGGLATGTASMLTGAPGAVILYAILGVAVWPSAAGRSGGTAVGLLGAAGAKAAWCVLWAGGAVLSLLPAQRAPGAISDVLSGNADGAPAFLASMERWLAHGAAGRGLVLTMALAVLELAIGVGVFFPSRGRVFLILGIGVSLAFWAVGQNFGEILSGSSTDPNAAPLFVLLGLALIPTTAAWRATYSHHPTPARL